MLKKLLCLFLLSAYGNCFAQCIVGDWDKGVATIKAALSVPDMNFAYKIKTDPQTKIALLLCMFNNDCAQLQKQIAQTFEAYYQEYPNVEQEEIIKTIERDLEEAKTALDQEYQRLKKEYIEKEAGNLASAFYKDNHFKDLFEKCVKNKEFCSTYEFYMTTLEKSYHGEKNDAICLPATYKEYIDDEQIALLPFVYAENDQKKLIFIYPVSKKEVIARGIELIKQKFEDAKKAQANAQKVQEQSALLLKKVFPAHNAAKK